MNFNIQFQEIQDAKRLYEALADVLCWFDGFETALKLSEHKMNSGIKASIRELEDLKANAAQAIINATSKVNN